MHINRSEETPFLQPFITFPLDDSYKPRILIHCLNVFLFLYFQFQDFRFLCPNDTVFDQQNLVCTNWFEVDCQQSVALFLSDFGTKKLTSQG